MVEILRLVNEISSLTDVSCKKGTLKNFSKFTGKHQKQSSGGVLLKLQAGNLKLYLKRDSNTGVFLSIL